VFLPKQVFLLKMKSKVYLLHVLGTRINRPLKYIMVHAW
jgi:hypothetical protein